MRGLLISVLSASVMGGCATASGDGSASDEDQRNLGVPAHLRPHIVKIQGIGKLLFMLDKVSATGTEVLLKRVPDFRSKGLGGYLPLREGDDEGRPKDTFLVSFFTRESPPRVAYEIRIKPNSPPGFEAFDPPKVSRDSLVNWVRARQAAIDAVPAPKQPINPVMLPGRANDEKGILVYLLAGTDKPDVAVLGQHFRVLMPENGESPTYVMPLSDAVLEVPVKGGSNGERPEGLLVTNLASDWPLETHVFVSLQFNVPVYVETKIGVWRVDGEKIALVSRRRTR